MLISNRGDRGGVGAHRSRSCAACSPTLKPLGLEADDGRSRTRSRRPTQAGNAFMSIFTTFGAFSIAAGILLIFLIFVMLAAERRGELGIARAVGTAAATSCRCSCSRGWPTTCSRPPSAPLLGIAVAYGMVLAHGRRVRDAPTTCTISYSVKPTSFVVALRDRRAAHARGRGVLGVARQPDEHRRPRSATCRSRRAEKRRRRRWVLGGRPAARRGARRVGRRLGKTRSSLGLGVSLVILSLVPLLRLGLPDRVAYTGAGLALVVMVRCSRSSRWIFGRR